DTVTPLFKERLHQYAVMGRWAEDLALMGWGEGTNIARMGLTDHKMTFLSPAHPEFRKFEVDQFVQLVKDGADGFQFDKTAPTGRLDFNPRLSASPDRSLPEGILATLKEIL